MFQICISPQETFVHLFDFQVTTIEPHEGIVTIISLVYEISIVQFGVRVFAFCVHVNMQCICEAVSKHIVSHIIGCLFFFVKNTKVMACNSALLLLIFQLMFCYTFSIYLSKYDKF